MQEAFKKKLLSLKVNVDKGIENYGDDYEEQLKKFINGYDFEHCSAPYGAKTIT